MFMEPQQEHPIHTAARNADVDAIRRLIGEGVSPMASDGLTPLHAGAAVNALTAPAPNGSAARPRTPFDLAIIRGHNQRIYPLLLRAGATHSQGTTDAYLRKVHAAGGIKKYERAHLNAIAATFIPKLPLLPPEMIRRVAEYAFHVGDY